MPSAADFEAAMRRAGVSDDRLVVVYDDADSTAAARAWWLLRYFGHRRSASSTAASAPGRRPGTRPSRARRVARFAGLDRVAGNPRDRARPGTRSATSPRRPATCRARRRRRGRPGRDRLLLDARAGERYRGETEPVDPVAGHIPGAVSAPTAENVNADGTFRPAADLAARFRGLGVTADVRGRRLLRLRRHRRPRDPRPGPGRPPGRPLLGSWSDWITDPARPVATGPELGTPA